MTKTCLTGGGAATAGAATAVATAAAASSAMKERRRWSIGAESMNDEGRARRPALVETCVSEPRCLLRALRGRRDLLRRAVLGGEDDPDVALAVLAATD